MSGRGKKFWRGLISITLMLTMLLSFSVVSSGETGYGAGGGSSGPKNTVETTGESSGKTTEEGASQPASTELTQEQLSTLAEEAAAQSATSEPVLVEINLSGGRINGLTNKGWKQSTVDSYIYMKEVEAGTTVTLEVPYRSGYDFAGWSNGETVDSYSEITVTEKTELRAVWNHKIYNVSFKGWTEGKEELTEIWSANVPYGYTLWTIEDSPWEEPGISWTEDTSETKPDGVTKIEKATVMVSSGEDTQVEIPVTRYTQDQTVAGHESYSEFYYTFTIEDTPYFTYGGPYPENEQHNFAAWKMDGAEGYTVLEDNTGFTAQYTAKKSYIFNIYYYLKNGAKAQDPSTVVKAESEVTNGLLQVEAEVPSIRFYEPGVNDPPAGIEAVLTGNKLTLTADVEQTFQGDTHANKIVSIVILYEPSEVDYKVVYHLQNVGEGTDYAADYKEVGSYTGRALIGETVSVKDKPGDLSVDFSGFEADVDTQRMIQQGRVLEERLLEGDTAVINMYYNRSYYHVYTLTNTKESDSFDPDRVQYGAQTPSEKDGSTLVKTGYTFAGWKWYKTDETGKLVLENKGTKPDVMPGYDLYVVAQWDKHETKMQVVYWIEDANSGSFQNTYQMEVTGVPTDDRLVMYLEEGKYDLALEDEPSVTFPVFTETFEQAIIGKYGDKNYTQYFTFDPETTYQKEVANQNAAGDPEKQELHYAVKADGTSTINVYYKRNLYTLQFVIQRNNGNTRQIASSTNGAFSNAGWSGWLGSADIWFTDFPSSEFVKVENSGKFGNAAVLKEYRTSNAVRRGDERSAVGRFAKVKIDTYQCFVYYLTARFEADIAELWPTMENISTDLSATYSNRPQYISMGPDSKSAYWESKKNNRNKNILNRYSTMDPLIINNKSGIAVSDNAGTAQVTHQMCAYWARSRDVATHQYFYLYEVLDTTLQVNEYPEFKETEADGYRDGTIVKWRSENTEPYLLYVYRKNNVPQNSTAHVYEQNQPAKYGFKSMGQKYKHVRNTNGKQEGNVYFFYQRNTYTLSIYNVNGNWVPTQNFLTQPVSMTYTNELTGQSETGEKSLAQLGWVEVVNTDSEKQIRLKYGAQLDVIGQETVTDAFQRLEPDPLKYPYKSMGVNQYYFHKWYKDQKNTAEIDWTEKALQSMSQDQVLYTGWTTPRYRIVYTLNGGTWTDDVDLTMVMDQKEGETIILYYPHLMEERLENERVAYWYVVEQSTDYLYMRTVYISNNPDDVLEQHEDGHYYIRKNVTLDEMKAKCTAVDPGTAANDDVYICLMMESEYSGEREDTSHRNYVNRHVISGNELPEPKTPVRNGYDFLGWYYFDEASEEKPFEQKIYLSDTALHSYKSEYVYVDSAGAPHLLYKEGGRLYYYDDQTGYKMSFEHGASTVGEDRTLYAAWKGQNVNKSKVLHLVEKAKITSGTVPESWSTVTINGIEYYQIQEETKEGIETGITQVNQAIQPEINDGRIWLPEKAQIDLQIGADTPTGTSDEAGFQYEGEGYTFKVRIPDVEYEAYEYYAYFIYSPVYATTYTVYEIDLREAVARGILQNYSDTFGRYRVLTEEEKVCILGSQRYTVEDMQAGTKDGVVTVNAPTINGYTVYDRWVESLYLESDPQHNNIYFYYVNPKNSISVSITYHFMENGKYTDQNVVEITEIPAQLGQRMSEESIRESYTKLIETAERMRGYAGSANEAQKDLYDRYKNMTVTGKADLITGTYPVDSSKTADLDLAKEKALYSDYIIDSWSPAQQEGESIVLSDKMKIHVYLKDAEIQLNKKDSSGEPLKGAQFTLERFEKVPVDGTPGTDTTVYEGEQYQKDESFEIRTAESNEEGKVSFRDLSTNIEAGYIYRVTETKGPEGHIPLAEPIYLKVPYEVTTDDGATQTYYKVTYDIINPGIVYLPNAGGFGVYIPLLVGGGIFSLALVGGELFYGRTRNKRRNGK